MNNMAKATDRSPFDLTGKRVFVAGRKGMVGSAIVRRLEQEPCEILTVDRATLDLTRQRPTELWLHANRPQVVIVAAGCVGGILANNSFPVEFLADNLAIELNVIRASHHGGVEKLLFLGSSCVYPKFASSRCARRNCSPANLNQQMNVRHCQNRRHQAVPSLSSPICSDFISVMPPRACRHSSERDANGGAVDDRGETRVGFVVPGGDAPKPFFSENSSR